LIKKKYSRREKGISKLPIKRKGKKGKKGEKKKRRERGGKGKSIERNATLLSEGKNKKKKGEWAMVISKSRGGKVKGKKTRFKEQTPHRNSR